MLEPITAMNTEPNPDNTARSLLHDYLRHEGEHITHRIDWFLITHAILFEAFFAAARLRFKLPILFFGVATSVLWLIIGLRQNWTMCLLRKALGMEAGGNELLKAILRGIAELQRMQPCWYKWIRATPVFTIVTPALTIAAWLALLVAIALESRHVWVFWVPLACLVPTVVFACWVSKREPNFEEEPLLAKVKTFEAQIACGKPEPANDIIVKSPDGTRYRLKVANDGTLSTEAL